MNPDWTAVLTPLAVGGIFASIGIGMLIFGQTQRAKAKATETWPTLSGAIVSSHIDQQRRTQRSQGRTYTRTTHMPVVEYTYELGGKTFRGSKIFPGANMSFDLGTAQGIINRYQAGQPTTVHYNPADPTQAVLETKAKGGNLLFILGAVFAVIGLVACLAAGASALLV